MPAPSESRPCMLETPSFGWLPAYAEALRLGWNPNPTPEASREQLVRMAVDPFGFLAHFTEQGGTLVLPDGSEVPRLPDRQRWIIADDLVGAINLRWQEGTAELPDHVMGHIGYNILPEHEGRGHATRALALMLDEAREVGLAHVDLVCEEGNLASRRVIEKNGGRFVETFQNTRFGEGLKLRFRIGLS